ncbi:HAD family phosphatase [Ruminococcaceae bacterium OttesenSCG-928-I18]|nr:HAD family phosphatase [Ruminococcaceae bacterium OttesenSCG-928-I18]
MYKNLVFDLGGVVVNYNPRDYLMDRFFYERLENKLFDAVFGSEEWIMLDRGEMSLEEANEIFLQRGHKLDIAFEMQAVLDNWPEMLTDRKATINLMRLFKKKGYQLYYLSNISHEMLGLLRQRPFWSLFDGGIASCEVGICKPDPEIYEILLQKYHLSAHQTIFADDRKENALGAFSAGITGIQFHNVKNFCNMLLSYGINMD